MPVMHSMHDEAAVRQLVKDYAQAINRQDSIACTQPFSEDAVYRTVCGSKLDGRVSIAQHILSTCSTGQLLDTDIECVRFIRADVAWIEFISRLHSIDIPFEYIISTVVAVKEDSNWRIVTFSNSGIYIRPDQSQYLPD